MNRTITVLLTTVAALVGLGRHAGQPDVGQPHQPTPGGGKRPLAPMDGETGAACMVGFHSFCVVASRDYRSLERWVWPIYGITLVSLFLVLTRLAPRSGSPALDSRGPTSGSPKWRSSPRWPGIPRDSLYRMQTFTTGVLGTGAIAMPLLALIVIEPTRGRRSFGVCHGGVDAGFRRPMVSRSFRFCSEEWPSGS